MDSWSAHTQSPALKFEHSPAESFLSTPDEMYPSLFGTQSPALSPQEIMTPKSCADAASFDVSALSTLTPVAESVGTPATPAAAGDKKPTKKRKSWGQVLPEPKTNLPPRKRAKTEDEKEQRRVERVLRNRRAAQSSRERKRLEVEALEKRNQELENRLRELSQAHFTLLSEVQKIKNGNGTVGSLSLDALNASPVTFSAELFGSQDSRALPSIENGSLQQLQMMSTMTSTTVNPASLSPSLTPVPESNEEVEEHQNKPATVATQVADVPASTNVDASPDTTQHPAAVLCPDLQCRSAEAPHSTWLATSQQQLHPALVFIMQLQLCLSAASTVASICQRPLTQIAMSMKARFSLLPSPSILNTIIWLVTTPRPSAASSTNSSDPMTFMSLPATSSSRSNNPSTARSQTRRSTTLRLRTLRKILTCSPSLARPLLDATMAVLRLVSSEDHGVDQVRGDDASAAVTADGKEQRKQQRSGPTGWPEGAALPSKEILLTLAWAITVESKRMKLSTDLGSHSVLTTTTPTITKPARYILNVSSKKRGMMEVQQKDSPRDIGFKRTRLE